MNVHPFLFSVVIALLVPGSPSFLRAQQPVLKPFVTLDASSSGSRSSQQSNWESGWGAYDRTTSTAEKVDVNVRNAGRVPCSVRVLTVFLARPMSGTESMRAVCGMDDQSFDLTPSRDAKYSVASPVLDLRDQNYSTINQRLVQGRKMEGWIVCVLDKRDDGTLQMKASTASLESLGNDRANLARLVADYSRDHGAPGTAPTIAEGAVRFIYGQVLSIRTGSMPGVLIGCKPRDASKAASIAGTVFLEYHPDQARLAVGSMVDCQARKAGTYNYADSAGEQKMVPTFSFLGSTPR